MKKRSTSVKSHLKEKYQDVIFKELHELDMEKAEIAKKIVRYRIENNLTQEQLAGKLSISQQQISKVENGDFSSISTLAKILLALGYFIRINTYKLSFKRAAQLKRKKSLFLKTA